MQKLILILVCVLPLSSLQADELVRQVSFDTAQTESGGIVDGEDPLRPAGQWFDQRTGAWIGAVGGGVIGLWGGLIGVLAGRGRARGFVLASANILLVTGLVSLGGGIVALLSGQPYTVWFPLLLLGSLLVVIIGVLWRVLPQRYEQPDPGKMRAMDA